VFNLPETFTEHVVRHLFAPFGKIQSCDIYGGREERGCLFCLGRYNRVIYMGGKRYIYKRKKEEGEVGGDGEEGRRGGEGMYVFLLRHLFAPFGKIQSCDI
jgi:hypothetical protein